jgi:hypothetical protein
MPLTACPDCQTQVSDAAPSCPKCGRPMGTALVRPVDGTSGMAGSYSLFGAFIGFMVGGMLVWGGCGGFGSMEPKGYAVCAFGGAVFAILGAILGAVIGR